MSDRQDDRGLTEITFTLPAGHKWTTVEAALREAHDQEYEMRMYFFWECERLKEEVGRLTEFTTRTIIPNEELQAKVERLTKAGDAMASIIKYHPEVNTFDPVPNVVKRWNAAKEGKGHE